MLLLLLRRETGDDQVCFFIFLIKNKNSRLQFFFQLIYFFPRILFYSTYKHSKDYPWELYSLKELLHATNDFHNDNKIGEGGFGSVYWGRTSKGNEAMIMSIFVLINQKGLSFFFLN